MQPGKDYIGVGCGALVLNEAQEALLLQRSLNARNQAGYWSQPGGTVEFGETVVEAIKREVNEELGVKIELQQLLGYTDHIMPEAGQHWVAIAYLAKILEGEPENREPDKHGAIGWFPLHNLPEPLTETTQTAVEAFRRLKSER